MENPLICQILSTTESFLAKTLSIVDLNIETGNIGYIYLILLCFISNPDLFKESISNIFTFFHFFVDRKADINPTIEYVGFTVSTLRRAFLEKKISKADVDILLDMFAECGILTRDEANQVTL